MTAELNLVFSSRIRSKIWAWMVTSRAVVGSSANNSSGSAMRAMAMTMRCFMPPENWWGKSSFREGGMPTIFRISSTFSPFSALDSSGKWRSRTSRICCPTVMVGFRLVMGSWKIMEMRFPRRPSIKLSGCSNRLSPL